MLKIYASRDQEQRLIPLLGIIFSRIAEFKVRVVTNYPIKDATRKIKGKNAYKVVSFPTESKPPICSIHGNHTHDKDVKGLCRYLHGEKVRSDAPTIEEWRTNHLHGGILRT